MLEYTGLVSEKKISHTDVIHVNTHTHTHTHTMVSPINMDDIRLFPSNNIDPIKRNVDQIQKSVTPIIIKHGILNTHHAIMEGSPWRNGRLPVIHSNTTTPKLQKSTLLLYGLFCSTSGAWQCVYVCVCAYNKYKCCIHHPSHSHILTTYCAVPTIEVHTLLWS